MFPNGAYNVITCVTGEASVQRAEQECLEGWAVTFSGTRQECMAFLYRLEGAWISWPR
ncbi:hypothetical protein SAMN04489716_9256 [Actinoplanes derwentensis]|uniref:MbtH protein n=1 Tax=Actinoplanes derwentensis TaxID=113562 RepID=A0A1H2DDI8_9ACTN|nr:hypothetical protein Ade03nite_85040 [Actinoplanes derwentensis]SDT80562.1 hypothetical protein SAMN04489716_9256 [Actinoplanes derwentensis]